MREEDSQGKQDGTAVRDWHLDLGAPRNHAPRNYLAWELRELRIHTPIIVLFGGGALISVHEQSGFLQLKKKKSLRKRDGGQLVCLKAVYEIRWGMSTVLLLNE